MEELILQVLEKAKQDKKTLQHLKSAAVRAQNFECAANLREMETTLFPETAEVKNAKKQARELNLIFRMVEMNVSEPICWLVSETLKLHKKKKGKFSMDDAANLMAKKNELFEEG